MDTSYLNVNGQILPREEAGLSTSNRAFKYGDGVFETIRVKDGQALFIMDHYDRLCRGINLLKIIMPSIFSVDYISNEINRLLKANKITKGGRLRFTVFRGGNGLYTPSVNDLSWVMEVDTIETNDFELNKNGLHIGIYKERRLVPDIFCTVKSISKLPYILAALYAQEHGWDDCLLENEKGVLMEAVSSNLFLRMGNTFYTPPLSDGCLPGTMRKQIIDIIKENGGTVIENSIRTGHLEQVDEVFITNSISGVKWVGAYEQKRYFHDKASELIDLLNEATAKNNTSKKIKA